MKIIARIRSDFPTKFGMVDPILNLNHNGKIIARMSVNPSDIIKNIEIGTSPLKVRVEAINKLKQADYKVGIKYLYENLSERVKKDVFFEVIFMTYSFVHRAINTEAFPTIQDLYDKEKMTGRGMGKYTYKPEYKKEGEQFFKEKLKKYFPSNEIKYIV